MSSIGIQGKNQEATIYVGNLDPQVTESLLFELFVQIGPVSNVYIPKEKHTGNRLGYGFVEFKNEDDVQYAINVMNMIKLFGKPIKVSETTQEKKVLDVGANLFIGNLDPEVDEKVLYDTFQAFGTIIGAPKIVRDPETHGSRGFGFVSYDSFHSSDMALEAMNGQYLCNKQISVKYALKAGSKTERHGDAAERLLAERTSTLSSRLSGGYPPPPPMMPPSLSLFPSSAGPSREYGAPSGGYPW